MGSRGMHTGFDIQIGNLFGREAFVITARWPGGLLGCFKYIGHNIFVEFIICICRTNYVDRERESAIYIYIYVCMYSIRIEQASDRERARVLCGSGAETVICTQGSQGFYVVRWVQWFVETSRVPQRVRRLFPSFLSGYE